MLATLLPDDIADGNCRRAFEHGHQRDHQLGCRRAERDHGHADEQRGKADAARQCDGTADQQFASEQQQHQAGEDLNVWDHSVDYPLR